MPYALRHPQIWYERQGDGEPLLLVTGFTISSAVFEPILPLYRKRFHCITYDNRGAGRSGAPLGLTSIPELAADAARLLDALGIDSAHVYGLSMGGMIAQELALRFPERVRALILGGTSPGGPRAFRPGLREVRALAAAAATNWHDRERRWLGEWLFSEEFRRQEPERLGWLLEHFGRHRAPLHGAWAHLWASVYHDTVSRLGSIQAPTLVLHGDCDEMTPIANARLLVERIPDAELRIVPASGHAYLLERPEESLEMLTGWLDLREPVAAGRPHGALTRRSEPLTRALGLPIGAMRTGASLVAHGAERLRGSRSRDRPKEGEGHRDVAPHRRAA